MEKNLLIIMILIFIILLVSAIWHHITDIVQRTSESGFSLSGPSHRPLPEQPDSPHNEYREIIKKSKNDYENFMGKAKPE